MIDYEDLAFFQPSAPTKHIYLLYNLFLSV